MTPDRCPACLWQNAGSVSGHNPWTVNCPRCRRFFVIGQSTAQRLTSLDGTQRRSFLTWLDGIPPDNADQRTIIDERLDDILRTQTPSVTVCADRLLVTLIRLFPNLGDSFDTFRGDDATFELLRATYISNTNQLRFFLEHLVELRLLEHRLNTRYLITAAGYLRAAGLSPNIERTQGFVAMWFDSSMDTAWADGFKRAIEGAGWSPHRIDAKEHVNKICDEIVSEIRRSRFIVADLTEERGGVYYEAGLAHGLAIPLFLTCRKGTALHFDLRQYNCIFWEQPEDLRNRLQARIAAVVGEGPLRRASA